MKVERLNINFFLKRPLFQYRQLMKIIIKRMKIIKKHKITPILRNWAMMKFKIMRIYLIIDLMKATHIKHLLL